MDSKRTPHTKETRSQQQHNVDKRQWGAKKTTRLHNDLTRSKKLDSECSCKRCRKQPTIAPTQDSPSRYKHIYHHHTKQQKEEEHSRVDYNIESIRQNPEQLKRCRKTTPLYTKYTQIKTIEIEKGRIQLDNTHPLPETTVTNRHDIAKIWNNIVKTLQDVQKQERPKRKQRKEYNTDEKIRPQAEIIQMGQMHTSKKQACERIAKAGKRIQEQGGETVLYSCIQSWKRTTRNTTYRKKKKNI